MADEVKNERHILLTLVSPINPKNKDKAWPYTGIAGDEVSAVQTNESVILTAKNKYGEALTDVFFIVSGDVAKVVPELDGRTHLEFLQDRIKARFENPTEQFHQLNYSYESDTFEQNMLEITDIARTVTKYARANQAERVIVDADMTGGPRSTVMMLLAILELLKHNGLVLGEVLYADFQQKQVYQATPIQRMFTLISGVNEFARFSSVYGLQDYFRGEQTCGELTALLDRMDDFADTLRVCNTDYIKSSLFELVQAKLAFSAAEKKSLSEQIFDKMLTSVFNQYARLGNASDIDIIRWCIDNDFIQQAITLCTEWLPGYIVDSKIAYTDNQALQDECAEKGKEMSRDWKKSFIIECKSVEELQNKTTLSIDMVRKILTGRINDAWSSFIGPEYKDVSDFMAEYDDSGDAYARYKDGKSDWKQFKQRFPLCANALKGLYNARIKENKRDYSFGTFLDTYKVANWHTLPQQIIALKEKYIVDIFDLPRILPLEPVTQSPQGLTPDEVEAMDEDLRTWYKRYCALYEYGAFQSAVPAENMLECLMAYKAMQKQLRNQINHAATGRQRLTGADIKSRLGKLLNLLENAR